tara:strand:- start:181 stop:504 length:324 start_codon:yes stop_codon:yes gene_type:complete
MVLAYYDLSFNERAQALKTLVDYFNPKHWRRIQLAIEVCDEIPNEADKCFRLEQTIDVVLWSLQDAINCGFYEWKTSIVLERHKAIKYHNLNTNECSEQCKVCEAIT